MWCKKHRGVRWLLFLLVVPWGAWFVMHPFFSQQPFNEEASWKLQFRPNETIASSSSDAATFAVFKILQVADIHLGEAENTEWGPRQDVKTFHVLDRVIVAEKPDLIVLSGDQLTANNVDKNATAYYRLLGQRLSYYGIPWALIFGNHDDAPLEVGLANGTVIKTTTKTSREQLIAVDQEFPLSLTQSSNDLFGVSNYVLNVHYPTEERPVKDQDDDDVAVQLFFLDSGGGTLPNQLQQNQIDWFHHQHRQDVLGAVAFQHIPAIDFVYKEGLCTGLHDNGIDALVSDPGIVTTLQQAGNVQWLAVGHNHGNDYCCPTNTNTTDGLSNLHLCWGRHSGYGGYGKWDRGARVYELILEQQERDSSSTSKESLKWRSWVRMESGEIIDRYDPISAS